MRTLNETTEYVAFNMSFEGIGDTYFRDEAQFCPMFVSLLAEEAVLRKHDNLIDLLKSSIATTSTFKELSTLITQLAQITSKKLVILIDEVDKSSNNQLFVSFLAMLRTPNIRRKTTRCRHHLSSTQIRS
jgi:hypothetical protein